MDWRIEPNGDPAVAEAVERAAGWTRGAREVARRFEASPGGHFLARSASGEALGAVSVVVYEDGALAWLGGMVVLPPARGRGVGRALLRRALAHAEERGARVVGLDATEEGRPLYEKEGFRVVARTPRWTRDPARPSAEPGDAGPFAIYPISSCEIMDLVRYDTPRFGAGRGMHLAQLMGEFPDRSFVAFHRATGDVAGYVLARENATGPLVADDPRAARWLLAAAERAGAPPRVVTVDSNPSSADVLRAAGYAPDGAGCARMTRGGPLPGRQDALYAIAAWAMG